MRRMVWMLRRRTERFHMVIHVLIGLLCGYLVHDIFSSASLSNLLFWGVAGSLLPDIDHFVFIYFYGKRTEYARIARKYIHDKKIRKLINFFKFNHKKNTGLYSHNILSLGLALYLFQYFVTVKDMPVFSVLALAWFMHYVFDIFEDLLFMKKLNSNWWLKFNKKTKDKDLVIP